MKPIYLFFWQVAWAWRHTADPRSFFQLATDLLFYRLLRVLPKLRSEHVRSVKLKAGAVLNYRLNRGDIWTIYEVWMLECYKPPFAISNQTLLDLGANIGLTSLWFTKALGFQSCIAVEPSGSNMAIVARNLATTAANSQLATCAVGPINGEAHFREYNWSTFNSLIFDRSEPPLSENGIKLLNEYVVPISTVPDILFHASVDARISLLKLDIEGGEQELLTGNTDWLDNVDACVAEFHPPQVNVPQMLELLQARGFKYYAPSPDSEMHWFLRPPVTATI